MIRVHHCMYSICLQGSWCYSFGFIYGKPHCFVPVLLCVVMDCARKDESANDFHQESITPYNTGYGLLFSSVSQHCMMIVLSPWHMVTVGSQCSLVVSAGQVLGHFLTFDLWAK